jgi:hypothetical protein
MGQLIVLVNMSISDADDFIAPDKIADRLLI